MLDGYFGGMTVTEEKKQRLLAVQAALEIAKAGATSSGTAHALDSLIESLEETANAIQSALDRE